MADAGLDTRARVRPRGDIGDRARNRLPGADVEEAVERFKDGEVARFKEGEAERFKRPPVGAGTTQRDSLA